MPGEPAPWFKAPTLHKPRFNFDTIAGRYVVLMFAGRVSDPRIAEALVKLQAYRDLFDDDRACFFGVTDDPEDVAAGRVAHRIPGIRWFLDYDRDIARQFRAVDDRPGTVPHWLLLDHSLRVIGRSSIDAGEMLLEHLQMLLGRPEVDMPAPVLVVPNIFDRAFCRQLIEQYEEKGGAPSGFMRDVDGKTVGIMDSAFKRRSDHYLDEKGHMANQARARIRRFLLPQIERAFQFRVTRMERYMVACYDGDGEGGFFRAHRDNTTAGTAHRRFACTINLNAEEFEGGDLIFPEFGPRRYRAPTGGAVVFSCTLLHEATPVTRGKRYAYLPFLYDEAAALQREQIASSGQVNEHLAGYRADAPPPVGA